MQRLYSMFPAGAPGIALLVLRGCFVAALFRISFPVGWLHAIYIALLGMLCVGILTPVVCVIAVIMVLLDLHYIGSVSPVELCITLLSTFAYAFLGPGVYSIDAKLFGRRMLVFTDSSQSRRDE